jgi:hypothetical protein
MDEASLDCVLDATGHDRWVAALVCRAWVGSSRRIGRLATPAAGVATSVERLELARACGCRLSARASTIKN